MHPYTPAWLADHAVPISIALVQIPLVLAAARRGRKLVALALGLSVAASAMWLVPSIWALARSEALPAPVGEDLALVAPLLALAACVAVRRGISRIGLSDLPAVVMLQRGTPGILLMLSLLLSGALRAGAPGRWLLAAGLSTWALVDVVHAERFYAASAAGDPEGQTIAAVEAALAASGWTMIGASLLSDQAQQSAAATGRWSEG